VLADADEVVFGWHIDAKTKKDSYVDFEITAKPGTQLAAQLAQLKLGTTNLAGLLSPRAALNVRSVGTLTDDQVAGVTHALSELRKSAMKPLASVGISRINLIDVAIDVLQKTAKSKKADAAVSLLLGPHGGTLLTGALVADGATLDKSLRQTTDVLQKSLQDVKSVKVGNETYKNAHLYTVSVPTPGDDLPPLVGDSLEVAVGIAGDKLLVAAGRDAAATLKNAIDNLKGTASKQSLPLEVRLAVTPLAKWLAKVAKKGEVKDIAATLAKFFDKAGDKSHLSVTVTPISRGVRVRWEIEEGLLKVVGQRLIGFLTEWQRTAGALTSHASP
jgi:hypothetical protein